MASVLGDHVTKTVAQKMRLREGARAMFVNAPPTALTAIQPPRLEVATELDGDFDYLHLFATTKAALAVEFARLRPHLAATGALWVSWPKARKLGTDLTLPTVIRIGYDHALVESVCLSIDDVWSALKFTHPKPGKVYRNSYGRLPDGWAE